MLKQQLAKSPSTGLVRKIASGICLAVLLAGPGAPPLCADDATANPAAIQVFKKVMETYASMVAYSDEGIVVITMNGTNVLHFSTKLARPNFYLIEWTRAGGATDSVMGNGQGVWSAGAGDFLQAEGGVHFAGARDVVLARGAMYSGRATATVPLMFFDGRLGNEPVEDLAFSVSRRPDEMIGNSDCYVFTRGGMGATNSLWIGKQDFLIHQVQTVAKMESLPAFTLTETHINIVLNRKFPRTDFIPAFPVFESAGNQ